jgi:predicted metalloendopeptidase
MNHALTRTLAGALCILGLASCGKKESGESPGAGAPPAESATTTPAPLSAGIDRSNFDPSTRPQDDLYRAVNGTWLSQTEIPADKSNYGAFTALDDTAREQIHAIIEEIASKPDNAAGSAAQKVGDYYASFMDEKAIEEKGLGPIQETLAEIDAVESKDDLPKLMARLARIGVQTPLQPYVHQDPKDSTHYAGDLWQGGLGLPDRDYYLQDDDKFEQLRDQYHAHIQKMFTLAQWPQPEESADAIMELETRIARAQWDKVDNRDPAKTYNPFQPASLESVTTAIDWRAFLDQVGFGKLETVLVSQPSYVTGLGKIVNDTSLDVWKAYYRWHLLSTFAPMLPKAFAEENFAFFDKTLNGQQEQEVRWKRGVEAVENALGEAVGKIYVERHFPAENKARAEALVKNLIQSYGLAIDRLEWMSADTRKAAQEKLGKFTYKIGYPDKWRDYSSLEVVKGDAIGNAFRASSFEYQRQINKLGQPIDRSEWGMTPQTVNAYYNPEMNEIVFPAAILQPPFFNVQAEDAVNYGGIGAVIGHEISHGFDDQGSQYDGDGNLRVWWTEEDRRKFEALGARLAAQYDAYEPIEGYHINGKFTLGENIADLGGMTIAHQAYLLSLGGKESPVIDGLTGDQRFFMGWAQVWRRKYRDENLLTRLKTDPHSPSEYRCNGVATNLPAFYSAFDVKESDKLYTPPEKRVKIW